MLTNRVLVRRARAARSLPRALGLVTLPHPVTSSRNTRMISSPAHKSRLQGTRAPAIQALGTPLEPFKTHPPSTYLGSPRVHSFYDEPSATWTFVTADPETRKAIVIDPVLDYDPSAGKVFQKSVKGLAAFLQREGYEVVRICETHVHADHLTGAYALKTVSRRMCKRGRMSLDSLLRCSQNTHQSTSELASSTFRRDLLPCTVSSETSSSMHSTDTCMTGRALTSAV